MRILLVSNMYPSSKNPTYGIFVKNFERNLLNTNLKIVNKAVIKGRGKNLVDKFFKYIYFIFNVLHKGMTCKYDAIYVHYVNHTAIPILILKFFKPQIKLILNAHGGDIYCSTSFTKFISSLSKKMMSFSDLIVCPSNYFRDVIHHKFGIRNEKIYVSPSAGVNLNLFKELDVNRNSSFIIGFVSRIDKDKGWDDFIKAISLIKKNEIEQDIKAIIIGDGEEREKMKKLIECKELQDTINYLGLLPQSELPFYLNIMDLFVFPSKRKAESLGLVALEAMACGTPIIGSNIAGIRDYLKDNKNGFFFNSGNYKQLKEMVLKYINLTDDQKILMKEKALETAKEYEEKNVAQRLGEYLISYFN